MMMIDTTFGATVAGIEALAAPALCPTGGAGLAWLRIDLLPHGSCLGLVGGTSGFATA